MFSLSYSMPRVYDHYSLEIITANENHIFPIMFSSTFSIDIFCVKKMFVRPICWGSAYTHKPTLRYIKLISIQLTCIPRTGGTTKMPTIHVLIKMLATITLVMAPMFLD